MCSDYNIFFFFNDTATTEIYTLSLHDALPIFRQRWRKLLEVPFVFREGPFPLLVRAVRLVVVRRIEADEQVRSEEHTSELQSRQYLVCRLLLEKKTQTTCTEFLSVVF